jgi:hypothetical protein
MSLFHKLLTAGFLVGTILASHAQTPDTRWRLRMADMQGQVKVDATVQMTSETAASCISGAWKKVVVEKSTLADDTFFPLSQPLSYEETQDGTLTLGRTVVCDGYLFLSGRPQQSSVQGNYYAFGLRGANNLGRFSLEKIN